MTHPCMDRLHSSTLEFLKFCINTVMIHNIQYSEKAPMFKCLLLCAKKPVSLDIASQKTHKTAHLAMIEAVVLRHFQHEGEHRYHSISVIFEEPYSLTTDNTGKGHLSGFPWVMVGECYCSSVPWHIFW